jgi:hypothetical protein
VISVSICEEINKTGSNPTAGDIVILSMLSHPRSGYLPVLEDHPGSVLRKLDWEGFIKELTILPYFSADATGSSAGR